MTFANAMEDALASLMANDEKIILIGEDLHAIRLNLFSRFGPERVISTPISESAYVGVSVHHCIEAASVLRKEGISSTFVDLRSVSPLDKETIYQTVKNTGNLIVVDEDYKSFGLSGEIAAIILESGLSNINYSRVCTEKTIPYSHQLEKQILPGTDKILKFCRKII